MLKQFLFQLQFQAVVLSLSFGSYNEEIEKICKEISIKFMNI